MRIGAGNGRGVGDVDQRQQLERARRRARPGGKRVDLEHLGDLLAGAHRRVEGGLRVLVDHGDAPAPNAPECVRGQAEEVLSGEADRAADHPRVGRQVAHDRVGERALARARLARHPEDLAGRDVEADVAEGADLAARRREAHR